MGDLGVETTGTTTHLPELPEADLHLLNDGDLTFAAVRTDEASLQVLLAHAGSPPRAASTRAVAVGTAWDMLAKGELSTGDVLDCLLARAGDRAEPQRGRAVLRAGPEGGRAVEPDGR